MRITHANCISGKEHSRNGRGRGWGGGRGQIRVLKDAIINDFDKTGVWGFLNVIIQMTGSDV